MAATWAAVSCTLICCQLWYVLDDDSAETLLAARGVPAVLCASFCLFTAATLRVIYCHLSIQVP